MCVSGGQLDSDKSLVNRRHGVANSLGSCRRELWMMQQQANVKTQTAMVTGGEPAGALGGSGRVLLLLGLLQEPWASWLAHATAPSSTCIDWPGVMSYCCVQSPYYYSSL